MTAKEFKSYREQVELLVSRGMIVTNHEEAERVLARVNYYRLSGYWFSFFDQGKQNFTNNLTFTDVVELYEYDKELRSCLFDALAEIEIAIRALIGHELGRVHPLIYLEAEHMGSRAHQYPRVPKGEKKPQETNYEAWITRFNAAKKSSKEAFVEHHQNTYEGKMPIWAAVEIMDWGLLSHLYSMCPNPVREEVAKRCGLTPPQLESWLKSLNVARNLSAHHARMYNKVYTIKPKLPQSEVWAALRAKSNRVFAIIAMTVYLSRKLGISSGESFHALLNRFPRNARAMQHTMGVPAHWEKYLEIIPFTC